jgi:hypothetical protein
MRLREHTCERLKEYQGMSGDHRGEELVILAARVRGLSRRG